MTRPAFALLVLLAGGPGCDRQPDESARMTSADVVHYDLELALIPEERFIRATARLQVVIPPGLNNLPLDFAGLDILSTTVDGISVPAERRGASLMIPLSGLSDTVDIAVSYEGVPVSGLYESSHGEARIVYTDSWPNRGRGWLPGVHHPSDPATFSLTLELPHGYAAAATGVPAAPDTLPDAVRYRWHLLPEAPAYSFAFAVGDFVLSEELLGDTLPLRYYMIRSDSGRVDQLERTPQMLTFLSRLLGPYAFDGYATVQVPFDFAGMENASASFLQARLFATGDAEAVQVHEVAHQWFGNRVVVADWRDLWLSEGMATYLTTLFYEHADGEASARLRWADMASLARYGSEGHSPLVPRGAVDPDEMLTWVPYQKGGSVLHLLRLVMGDEPFFHALRQTYERFAGSPLDTATFRAILEEASEKDLKPLFDVWVYGSKFPRLRTTWNPDTRSLAWTIAGDAGTLGGAPFLLEVRQRNHLHYAPSQDGAVVLEHWGDEKPGVRPVGVMMSVE